MPSIQPPSKVLVTGANGYIAMWVVRTLLENGYFVRGTVRSTSKGDYMRKYFTELGFTDLEDKLEIVVVKNIETPGAFDDAVKGVHAIEHMASPYHYGAEDPKELFGPAISGTVSILQSAQKYGSSVKRIVITTSTAAMVRPTDLPITFTENDWNEDAIKQVEIHGVQAPGYLKYFASKTLAEKAAFEFYKKNKEYLSWDLVTIAPPYVFGPIINEVGNKITNINTSLIEWYETIFESSKSKEALKDVGNAWVDVRDLARAHVRAIQREEAIGRVIVSTNSFKWHDWLSTAIRVSTSTNPPILPLSAFTEPDPTYNHNHTTPSESPTKPHHIHIINFDTSKAEKVLGMKKDEYITMEDCARDMIIDFKNRGW
ncbi:D-lactaldehyde dehydrogenase [Abortiporus biennis]|nr:D-lactaldehyde dehydrogenase [Abortiporus biennis]